MAQIIDTAGLVALPEWGAPAVSPRKLAVQAVRRVIRKADATDAEIDDALEALLEASKLED